jgi:hypothetical protein
MEISGSEALKRSSHSISYKPMSYDSKTQEIVDKEAEYMLQHIYDPSYDAKKEKLKPAAKE